MANNSAPKPEVNIYVDTIEEYNELWPQVCVSSVQKNGVKGVWTEPVRYVVEFEERDLRMLKNTSSPLHQKVYDKFLWIGQQLNMNILLFIGHIDMCEPHIDTLTKKIEKGEALFTNSLPTVFFIIACHGKELAYDLNRTNFSFQRKNIYSFGFNNLVHIYNGDVYNCEESHLKIPDTACDYEGSYNDKQKLLNDKGEFNINKYKNTETPNKLVQCCEAKFTRFSHIFVNYLNRRKCGLFTKKKILEKLQRVLRSSDTLPEVSSLSKEDSTFTNADALLCSKQEPCPIENPFSLTNADVFNEKREIRMKWEKIFQAMSPEGYAKYTDEDVNPEAKKADGKTLVAMLIALGKDRDAVVQYAHPTLGNLLHLACFYGDDDQGQEEFIKELILTTRNLKQLDGYGLPAVMDLIANDNITFGKKAELLLLFYKRDKESLLQTDSSDNSVLHMSVYNQDQNMIEFYLNLFPNMIYDIYKLKGGSQEDLLYGLGANWPLELHWSGFVEDPTFVGKGLTTPQILEEIQKLDVVFTIPENICQILLAYGADPNKQNHTTHYFPPHSFLPDLYHEENYGIHILVQKPLPVSEKIFILFSLYDFYQAGYFHNQIDALNHILNPNYEDKYARYNSNNNDRYSYNSYNRWGGGNNEIELPENDLLSKLKEQLDDKIVTLKTQKEEGKADSITLQLIARLEYFRENTVELIRHAIKVFEFCADLQDMGFLAHEEFQRADYVKRKVNERMLPFTASVLVKDHYSLLDSYLRGPYTSHVPKDYKAKIRQNGTVLMKNKETPDIKKLAIVDATLRTVLEESFLDTLNRAQVAGLLKNVNVRDTLVRVSSTIKDKYADLGDIVKTLTKFQDPVLEALKKKKGGSKTRRQYRKKLRRTRKR